MKKSIFILALTLIAIVGFSTESFAQRTITMQNNIAANVEVKLCSTLKILAAGEVYTTATTCTSAPCFISITTPCTGKITVNVPCSGTAPYTSNQVFSVAGSPPCTVTVDYTYDVRGNITININ